MKGIPLPFLLIFFSSLGLLEAKKEKSGEGEWLNDIFSWAVGRLQYFLHFEVSFNFFCSSSNACFA